MKKYMLMLLIAVTAVSLCACALIPIPRPAPTDAATETQPTAAPAAETAPAPEIGTLDDYVRTAAENEVSFGNGKTNTLRLPEILLDSADASAANAELNERFGEEVKGDANYTGAYALDYEAYLNGKVLSVVVIARYDGGNSYGLGYAFDVLTGKRYDNESLCGERGVSYSSGLDALYANLTTYYDDKWSELPGNESMREQTFDYANLRASSFYLDKDGTLTALVDIYAAVGGGHWVAQIKAE